MKRAAFLLSFLLFLAIGHCLNAQRPNFLIILTDDQQFNALQANGNAVVQTPHLDKLADQGLKFSNAHVVFSLCSPSRAAILTGRYGSANGVLELDSELNRDEKTIAQYLQRAGYQTRMYGKWHLKQAPEELGFDESVWFYANGTYYGRKITDRGREVRPEIHCDAYCSQRAVEELEAMTNQDAPFFVFFNTQTPHMDHRLTWPAREETKARYEQKNMPIPENRLDDLSDKPAYLKTVRNRTQAKKYGYPGTDAIQKHTLEYYAVITEMDDFVGNLLQKVEELDLTNNTYILFLSDNGWMLGDHGFTSKVLPYRPSTHIPMVIAGPGIEAGKTEALALNIDLLPTILDLAGVDIPANVHGKSMRKVLSGKKNEVRKRFVYEGLGGYGGAQPNLTVLDGTYRYIVTYKNENLQTISFRELYNQQADPWEMNNLLTGAENRQAPKVFDRAIRRHFRKVLNRR